ncbi:TetR/AcrR family transcriptional regulator [Leucobacter chinensis]|uniref:TetR/AcrR family transcriptional regulator n=1 Tax=Leucobacter chinensis TaxID=2851010 RepID=UPI001C24C5CE|nr:TetR/AcrR family transcriptional regulator [Leucobacter chinensis]
MTADTPVRIMQAAKEIVAEHTKLEGVALSLDSVAKRAGLTKPGLMYYFPNKQALMVGLVEFAAQQWHDMLREHAGAEPAELTVFARYRAYVEVATTAEVSRADYWIFSDALYHPSLSGAWQEWLGPWFTLEGAPEGARGPLTAARFCADGAWMSEATGVMQADDLGPVRAHALQLIAVAEGRPTR